MMKRGEWKRAAAVMTICVCSFSWLMPVRAEENRSRQPEAAAMAALSEQGLETAAEADNGGRSGVVASGEAARKEAEEMSEQSGGPGAAAQEKDGGVPGKEGQTGKKGASLGMFTVTGYCGCEECSGGSSLTYSGTVPKANHTLSADMERFPAGTKLMIDDVIYTVEDMGSNVRGNWVDIYFDVHEEAEGFGMQTKEVFSVIE